LESSSSQWVLGTSNRKLARGFIGMEDLGGGLAAIFNLEIDIAMNNGVLQQRGRLFGRMAYVGVQSEEYGSLMPGRCQTTCLPR
jgi:predicted porin